MSDITSVEAMPQQIPIGEAGKIRKHTKYNWRNREVLFSPVKNEVVMVNPNISSPLQLEKGKPSPIGLFAKTAGERPFKKGELGLEVLPEHLRSALLGRVIFKDNQGNFYRDVDIKGGGFLSSESDSAQISYKPAVQQPGGMHSSGSRLGLLGKTTALYDYERAEELAEAGIRVARTLGIIELQEIIVNGRKISLDEARKRGLIDKSFKPVIELRAFGTRARISDLTESQKQEEKEIDKTKQPGYKSYERTAELLLEDAKKIVAQELGKESITDDEYLEWFARTLGKNMRLTKSLGQHGYLAEGHNITLDCRLVDFDSFDSTEGTFSDKVQAQIALAELYSRVKKNPYDSNNVLRSWFDPYSSYVPQLLGHLVLLFNQGYNSEDQILQNKRRAA